MIGPYVRRLRSSQVSRQFVGTVFWSLVGEAMMRGLSMLGLIFVARILGPATFGEFGLIRTTLLMVAGFGGLGLGLMANRFVSEHRTSDPEFSSQIIGASYLISLVSGLILGTAVFASSGLISDSLLHAPQLGESLRLASFVLVGTAVSGAQIGIMQGLQAYRNLAIGNLVQGILTFACGVVGAYYGGLTGAMYGIVIQAFAGVAVFHILIARETRRQNLKLMTFEFRRVLPLLWTFSLPTTLCIVAVGPFKWISETWLARDAGFAHLGTFHAAMVIANVLIAVASTLNAPLITVTAGLQKGPQSATAQFVNLFGSWYAFLLLAIPVALFPDLLALSFSAEFRTPEFRSALLLLVMYCALLVYYQGMTRIFMMSGSMWIAFMTNVVEGVVLFVAFALLASHGIVGLCVAYLLSYVARILISIPFLLRTRLIPLWLLFDRYFLLSFAVLLGVVLLQYHSPP